MTEFNQYAARWAERLVNRLDDESAQMLVTAVVWDVLVQDMHANERVIKRYTAEVQERARKRLAKALVDMGVDDHSLTAGAALISKSKWNENKHPRSNDGRFRRKGESEIIFQYSRRSKPRRPMDDRPAGAGEINLTDALRSNGRNISMFSDEWNRPGPNSDTTNRQTYDRIAAGSQLLGNVPSTKGKAAAQFGQFVGQYGPEAEKVIGPSLRRAAYRYRGTERAPDPELIRSANAASKMILAEQGRSPNAPLSAEERQEATRAASIVYLSNRLPKRQYSDLQLKSGKVPPSEGILLNSDGKIITQAVGFADDHYLPFNLKNLKGLQGGSYIRTRATGGPTTEDIYAGLLSGARQLTVVSRSGVFTINFDDHFRGSRRYNDKAAQMVDRYAKTLDAVQSQQVDKRPLTLGERAAIRDEVENEWGGLGYSAGEIETEIKRRTKEFQARPQLTKDEIDAINRKAVDLAESGTNAGFRTGSTTGASDRATGGMGGRVERIPSDPKKRIVYYRTQLLEDAMAEKENSKLRLDGEGYATALEAMREQFPYYISSVHYQHRTSGDQINGSFEGGSDSGYVAPRYLRPTAAQSGYYDKDVNGRGKFSAKYENYANWSNNPERRGARAEAPAEEKPAAPAGLKQRNEDLAGIQRKAQSEKESSDALWNWIHELNESAGSPSPELKSLAADRHTFEVNFADPVKRERMVRAAHEKHESLDSEENRGRPEGARLLDSLGQKRDLYRVVSGALNAKTFDPSNFTPGVSPETPFEFVGREFQPDATPDMIMNKYNDLARNTVKSSIDWGTSDETLRKASQFYGDLARMIGEKADRTSILTLASRAGMDARVMNELYRRLDEPDSSELEDFRKRLLQSSKNIEMMRRLRANFESSQSPKLETRETSFDSSSSMSDLADEIDDEIAAVDARGKSYEQPYRRALETISGLMRDLDRGDLTPDEFSEEARIIVSRLERPDREKIRSKFLSKVN